MNKCQNIVKQSIDYLHETKDQSLCNFNLPAGIPLTKMNLMIKYIVFFSS